MNWRGFKIEIHRAWTRNLIEIIPICETDDISKSRIGILVNGKWEAFEYDAGMILPEEAEKHVVRIPYDWAKQLHIELEKLFGSPKATATESELNATKYHLEDMRELVFEKRDIQKEIDKRRVLK